MKGEPFRCDCDQNTNAPEGGARAVGAVEACLPQLPSRHRGANGRRWMSDLGCDGLDDMNMIARELSCRYQGLPWADVGIFLPCTSNPVANKTPSGKRRLLLRGAAAPLASEPRAHPSLGSVGWASTSTRRSENWMSSSARACFKRRVIARTAAHGFGLPEQCQ